MAKKYKYMNWIGLYTLVRREVGRTKRVIGQAIIAPLITASLYIFVFGFVLGSKIQLIEGISYISFVFPGIMGMNMILAVFGATSFSIFFMKFQKTLDDLLTLPISYFEMVCSLLVSGIFRAYVIMLVLGMLAFAFNISSIVHPIFLFVYVLLIGIFFGVLGIVVGIWSDNSFEKIGLATNFLLTPLTFLGGAFYSVHMLPPKLQFLVHFNPIFYAIDGIRYSLTGYHDSSLALGLGILLMCSCATLLLCVIIFRTGWKLRA